MQLYLTIPCSIVKKIKTKVTAKSWQGSFVGFRTTLFYQRQGDWWYKLIDAIFYYNNVDASSSTTKFSIEILLSSPDEDVGGWR